MANKTSLVASNLAALAGKVAIAPSTRLRLGQAPVHEVRDVPKQRGTVSRICSHLRLALADWTRVVATQHVEIVQVFENGSALLQAATSPHSERSAGPD